jgi:transposase InsO family protein
VFELGKAAVAPAPSRSTVYRVLVRHRLVEGKARKRRREDYRRWERPGPMQLWQMDVMGSVRMVDGSEAKLISGVDDHSRFNVIAMVVPRATSRAVCVAFGDALLEYGLPEQVLTDNGKQFTGKYTRPRPAEVLFDRICRLNGIEHLLTKVRSPTTTGKVERWHQTIQRELLEEHPPFRSIADAQAAVDAWRVDYNTRRPHQSLDMAYPGDRFVPRSEQERAQVVLWLPPGLAAVAEPHDALIDRPVPPSGNVSVGPQQFWFGPHRAGELLTFWIDTTTVHISSNGVLLKTVPSRLTALDLARLARAGAREAGPPPARRLPGLLQGGPVEVDRIVNANGIVSIAHRQLPVGSPLAGQRVTLSLDGQLAHVLLHDGTLWRTLTCQLSTAKRSRLRGARPATTTPRPPTGPARVQRVVSSRGGIQVNSQRVQVGMPHARKIVTVVIDDTVLQILDDQGDVLTEVARTNSKEVTRHKAYRHTVNQA